MPISFTHIINPFLAPENSEHGIASKITYESLRIAVERAHRQGIDIEVSAVVLPGDEIAIEKPAKLSATLDRTVQDIQVLKPAKLFPLISDILQKGASNASSSYLIFTNMDIAVQPDFYIQVKMIAEERLGNGIPFIVYRRNIPSRYNNIAELPEMYREPGEIGHGYDCFVFPKSYADQLDLGTCCIGSAYFDYLLYIALDAISGFRMHRISDVPMTFHIGNDISWVGRIDYIEHNLSESIKAINRMGERYNIPPDSHFAQVEKSHFRPNARFDSWVLRKIKRLPGMAPTIVSIKRLLGRSH